MRSLLTKQAAYQLCVDVCVDYNQSAHVYREYPFASSDTPGYRPISDAGETQGPRPSPVQEPMAQRAVVLPSPTTQRALSTNSTLAPSNSPEQAQGFQRTRHIMADPPLLSSAQSDDFLDALAFSKTMFIYCQTVISHLLRASPHSLTPHFKSALVKLISDSRVSATDPTSGQNGDMNVSNILSKLFEKAYSTDASTSRAGLTGLISIYGAMLAIRERSNSPIFEENIPVCFTGKALPRNAGELQSFLSADNELAVPSE